MSLLLLQAALAGTVSPPAPFNPSNTLPDIEMLNQDIAALADGTAISSWATVTGNPLTQGVGADQPLKQSVDGHAVARFAGGADALYTDSPPASFMSNVAAGTIVVVKRTTTNPTTNLGVSGVSTGAATGNGRLNVAEGNTSGKHRISWRRLDADSLSSTDSAGTSVLVNGWEVVIAEANYAAGTRTLWVNGTQVVNTTGLATGNTSATGALRITLGNFTNLGAGFVGDVYYAAWYDNTLSAAQRDYLTSGFLALLGSPVGGGGGGGSGSGGGGAIDGTWGTVDFNSDFSAGTIDSTKWFIGNPDQPAGSAWYNTGAGNAFIYTDPTIGTVARLRANYSSGQITTAAMLSGKNKYTITPPTSGSSILIECTMRTPNVQGAWPTFWAWNLNGNTNEWDGPEIFGIPTIIDFTYHHPTGGGYQRRTVTGTPYDGLHSYAMRITTTQIIAYYDRVQVGTAMTNNDTTSSMYLILSIQGLSESLQPWSNSNQQLSGSGSYYQDVKRVTVWRGGTGPPPA